MKKLAGGSKEFKFKYKEKVGFVAGSFYHGQIGTIDCVYTYTEWFVSKICYRVKIDDSKESIEEHELVKIPKKPKGK